MEKSIIRKLFWIFWCSTTILTGLLAGFLTSHSIMFGRFLTWSIESGKLDLLHQTYTVFREASSPQVLYNSFFYLALVSGVIWALLAFLLKRDRIIAMIAGLSTLWISIVFFGSRFGRAEAEVLSGIADEKMTQLYVSLNMPLHTCFALFYTLSLVLLLVVVLRKNWQLSKTVDTAQ